MMAMQLSDAAQVLDGRCNAADVAFRGISTDSRKMASGELFFALQGPNFDGHDYLEAARARGAAAAAVSRHCDTELPLLEVADTRLALGRLAAHWRSRFELPVIAVTGSNGKTTVRAMTAAILAQCGRTLSTHGNLNNDIGLPLTLARLGADDRYAVVEMGANHPGEIEYLTAITRPTVAIVTNAGPAHLEGFGDLEGVARAKGELFAGLDPAGVAVINADDRFAALWRGLAAHCEIMTFGIDNPADFQAEWQGDVAGSRIRLTTPAGDTVIQLPLPGRHNVMNALAAAAAAQAAGAGLDVIRAGLESLSPVSGRYHSHHLPGGVVVIDDTYNANPGSLQVALEVLALAPGATWLVLGDMGELGDEEVALHRRAGEQARAAGVQRLYSLGELARAASVAFGDRGRGCATLEELLAVLRRDLAGPVHILVKGSRRMRMERVVEALCSGLHNKTATNGEDH
ncbi:MAG: UDP-N-acetylmuramoyl-tripeptide--D-alanyl-D-alanine ligase [Gammaproteobacteria bacterium]